MTPPTPKTHAEPLVGHWGWFTVSAVIEDLGLYEHDVVCGRAAAEAAKPYLALKVQQEWLRTMKQAEAAK